MPWCGILSGFFVGWVLICQALPLAARRTQCNRAVLFSPTVTPRIWLFAVSKRVLHSNPLPARVRSSFALMAQPMGQSSLHSMAKAQTYDAELRRMIASGKIADARVLLGNSTRTSFEKSVVYIVCETCRRSGHLSNIVPLLQSINFSFRCAEDDVMPLLKQCVDEKKIHFLQTLVDYLAQSRGLSMTAKAFSILLKGYGVARWEKSIDNVLVNIAQREVAIDIVLLNSAMDAYIKCGNINKAVQLFRIIARNAQVQSIFESSLPSTSTTSPSQSSSNRLSFESIIAYVKKQSSIIKPDARSFNIVLKVWQGGTKPEDLEVSFKLLDAMAAEHLQPTSVTISTLIMSCLRANDVDRAMGLLQDYAALASVEAFTSIIAKSAQDGKIDFSLSTLQMMIRQAIQPNYITWNCIMGACVGSKDLVRAKELLALADGGSTKILPNNGVVVSHQDRLSLYNAYVVACFKRFGEESRETHFLLEGLYTLMLMNKRRIPLETATYNAFMKSLIELSSAKEAVWLLKIMTAESGRGLAFDDYTYSALFTALGRLGYIDEAMSAFSMLRQEAVVNTYILNSLLSACVRQNRIGLALSIVQSELTENGASSSRLLDKASLCIVLSALQKVTTWEVDGKASEEIAALDSDRLSYAVNVRRAADRDPRVVSLRQKINQLIAETSDNKSVLLSPSLQRLYELVFSNIQRPLQYQPSTNITTPPDMHLFFELDKGFKLDKELLSLYRAFRLDLKVEVDAYVVAAVNSLFGVAQKAQVPNLLVSLSGDRQFDIRKETAKLVFDDLVLAGTHPQQIHNVLPFCGFTKQELRDYHDDRYLARIRSNAATVRIFQKHGWNKMNSGWSPI